jgi:hypothetical protein
VRRGAVFAGVAFPFPDAGEGALATERAALGTVRGGVSLYLEAFAVAMMVSGLMRLAAPSSLRRRFTARRTRSFCVTAPLLAAALSHFASSSAIRTDFAVKVVFAIESLSGGRCSERRWRAAPSCRPARLARNRADGWWTPSHEMADSDGGSASNWRCRLVRREARESYAPPDATRDRREQAVMFYVRPSPALAAVPGRAQANRKSLVHTVDGTRYGRTEPNHEARRCSLSLGWPRLLRRRIGSLNQATARRGMTTSRLRREPSQQRLDGWRSLTIAADLGAEWDRRLAMILRGWLVIRPRPHGARSAP